MPGKQGKKEETDMPELRFENMKIQGAELGEESCVPDLLGEHILQNHLKSRLDDADEIYEGYGCRKNAYPYRQYNSYTRKLKEKEIRTAVLENKYLKAVFLPEYGGRLWELWDKETGTNLLYTNDVLRFSNLAIRNAWFSGGVEWNIGVIGHHPYTVSPLYTAVTETQTGAPVLRMYEYERIRKVPYQMDFWLEEEDRFLNCRMRIVNESDNVIPMYWWSNIAVPEYESGRITVPSEKAFTNRDGAIFKVNIPIVDGIDITDYKKIPKSVDYFFEIDDKNPKYIANLNKDGYGLLHTSTQRLKSRKLFSWGNGQASDHWQEFLTDKAGRYIETQAGLTKTQYGCIPMNPHTEWEWLEQYGPVTLTGENQSHQEREKRLTGILEALNNAECMERKLQETAAMAKTRARVIMTGSGYGAFEEHGKWSEHLEFVITSDSLEQWKHFFETGVLHKPSADNVPDEFLINNENLEFLVKTLETVNKENWYAYYQAGIGCFSKEDYKNAEKFLLKSWNMEPNPWACHGLACTYLLTEKGREAVKWMMEGLKIENRISYLKEGLRILFCCKAYAEIVDFFERQSKETQEVGKLKFYYISALHRLGENKKAYEIMEGNGGFVIDDIREGEESVSQLWSELYEKLYGVKAPVPYKYDFKAS